MLCGSGGGQGVAKAPEPMAPVRYAQLPWADFEGRRWGLETSTALLLLPLMRGSWSPVARHTSEKPVPFGCWPRVSPRE